MRGIRPSLLVGLALTLTLLSGAAGAVPQDTDQNKEPGQVRVNGIRNPETHAYRAIAEVRFAPGDDAHNNLS